MDCSFVYQGPRLRPPVLTGIHSSHELYTTKTCFKAFYDFIGSNFSDTGKHLLSFILHKWRGLSISQLKLPSLQKSREGGKVQFRSRLLHGHQISVLDGSILQQPNDSHHYTMREGLSHDRQIFKVIDRSKTSHLFDIRIQISNSTSSQKHQSSHIISWLFLLTWPPNFQAWQPSTLQRTITLLPDEWWSRLDSLLRSHFYTSSIHRPQGNHCQRSGSVAIAVDCHRTTKLTGHRCIDCVINDWVTTFLPNLTGVTST